MCHLSRTSPEVVEVSCDEALPYGAVVIRYATFHSSFDFFRRHRICRGGTRGGLTCQKEKQIQEDEEANNFEGSPRQTQPKTRLARII
jgi:hypothetical protein